MQNNKIENINEFIIILVSVFLCACFFFNHSNLITDFGREVLISSEILNGQVLYKDILNIYGPLSYYINALALLVFGKHLNTFFIMGSLNCIIFSLLLYKIGIRFLSRQLSLCSSVFISVYCIYGFGLYDFQHPYTYAVTYGLTFAAFSVFHFLKFSETKSNIYLYISALFTGLSVCCKIEFLPLIFFYILFLLIYKIEIKKTFGFLLSFLVPFLIFLIPIIQGMNLSDIKNAFETVLKEVSVPSVVYFSKLTGSYFSFGEFLIGVFSAIISFTIFFILYLIFRRFNHRKFLLVLLTVPFFAAALFLFSGREFALLPIIILITLIVFLVKRSEQKYIILSGGAVACSCKTFFSLNLSAYGTYTLPLLLLTLIVLLNMNAEKIREEYTKFLIILLILVKLIPVISLYSEYNFSLKTDYGTIKTSKIWAEGVNEYIKFVAQNTNSGDKILHLQEGALLNFLTDRKTDMMFYALNLPYLETYGVDKVIDEIGKFQYITLINGFGSYYFGKGNVYFGMNQISKYISENFVPLYSYNNGDDFIIFLKKK